MITPAEKPQVNVTSADAYEILTCARADVPQPKLENLAQWAYRNGVFKGPHLLAAPHPDDICIAMGGYVADMAAQNAHLQMVVFYSGHRSAGWPQAIARPEDRIAIRTAECELEARWLRCEPPIMLNLPSYDRAHYRPDQDDIERLIKLLDRIKPAVVYCPSHDDSHAAHRACRALLCYALVRNGLSHVPVVTYGTPWGALAWANAYHQVSPAAVEQKELAIQAHVSQSRNADYLAYTRYLGRAYGAVLAQMEHGFHEVKRGLHGTSSPPTEVELFRIEYPDMPEFEDPLRLARSLLGPHRKNGHGSRLVPPPPAGRPSRKPLPTKPR
jgi:LmbE family N-acetylglucosaminyl deacetylase